MRAAGPWLHSAFKLSHWTRPLKLETKSPLACRFYMTDKRLVLSTAGSQEEARKIAHALVDRRLAACVNIVPGVESVYRWQGKVETATEWLLVMKTTAPAFPALSKALRELH